MADDGARTHVLPVAFRQPAEGGAPAAQAGRPVVVVLGMHRSGTSLCSHILGMLGVDVAGEPEDRDTQPSNAKGQWERLALRELQDRILALFSRGYHDPAHDFPLPAAWWADPRIRPIEREILDFFRQRMRERTLFGFKDPRTARLLPLWHGIFKELGLAPRIVLCLRNPAQVARSLAARDGLDPEIGEYRWLVYMADIFRYLSNWETCTIEFEHWFADPLSNTDKLRRFLGLEWPGLETEMRAAVADIVDARLRHHRSEAGEAALPLVRSFYELAQRFGEDPAAAEKLVRLVDQFATYQQMQRPLQREFERVSAIAAEAPTLERENTALEQKYRELEAELAERGAQAEAKLAGLRNEVDALGHSLAEAAERAEDAAAELEAARSGLEAARSGLEARDAALTRANRQAVEQRAELARREAALNDAIRLAEELGAEVRSMQADIAAGDAALARAEQAAAEWKAAAERAQAEWTAAAERAQADLAASQGQSGRWFDAAVAAAAEPLLRNQASRRRQTRLGPFAFEINRWRGRGSPAHRADRARDAQQWERAARFYVDALRAKPDDPARWVQLGHALKESGELVGAERAYRQAADLDKDHFDALLPLGDVLARLDRHAEAVAAFARALDLAPSPERRQAVLDGLTALGYRPG